MNLSNAEPQNQQSSFAVSLVQSVKAEVFAHNKTMHFYTLLDKRTFYE